MREVHTVRGCSSDRPPNRLKMRGRIASSGARGCATPRANGGATAALRPSLAAAGVGQGALKNRRWLSLFGVAVLLALAARSNANEPSHALIPQFENAQVTGWKTILKPGERLGMHRHEHGRVVVALQGGTLAIPQQPGGSRTLVLETGKAYWLDADPPGDLHGDYNPSKTPPKMMVLEMK